MDLKEYFDTKKGFGILFTTGDEGKVDAAVFARPHFVEDETLAWIMRDRPTYRNLQTNPHASYLFKENGSGYRGKRLFLTKLREEQNTELSKSLRRRKSDDGDANVRYIIFFKLTKELPLVEDGM